MCYRQALMKVFPTLEKWHTGRVQTGIRIIPQYMDHWQVSLYVTRRCLIAPYCIYTMVKVTTDPLQRICIYITWALSFQISMQCLTACLKKSRTREPAGE